ncbi:neuropeptide CCHamide-1 receptor [Patella vulgata]|uniref:neuropeptide CCHamide-1 receptor n=1 Tax=Patella vulgata TaxID=6465 RepID=UPI00217F7E7F|nr:neuropeptide CCHamide-1 receptor [Patella vulgata]
MEELVEEFCNKSTSDLDNCTRKYEKVALSDDLTPEAVLVPLVFSVIFFFGIVGNIFLICSFVKHKKLTAAHNIFVINLAVGDLMMLMVSLPFNSTWYTIPYWPYGEVICKMSFFVETLATAVTIATITVLSIERFLIISGKRSSDKRMFAIAIVVLIWTLSFYISLPDLISASTVTESHSGREWEYCYTFAPSWGPVYPKVNTMMRFLLLFVIPLCIISPLYLAIAYTIYFKSVASKYPSMKTPLRPDSNNSGNGKQDRESSQDKRKRLAISVLGLVWAFVLCWLPRHVYLLWFHFDPGVFDHFWHVFKIFGFCLMFANSAVNPIVFFILDKKFRQYVNKVLFCKGGFHESDSLLPQEGQSIAMTELQQCSATIEAV